MSDTRKTLAAQFRTSDDIIAAHNGHFFDRDTMRFFRSRVLQEVFCGARNVYFVTSELSQIGPRRYTVRAYDPQADRMHTVDGFTKLSRSTALVLARHTAEAESEGVQS